MAGRQPLPKQNSLPSYLFTYLRNRMSLERSLGPPPALYATLLGIPIPDCLISVNGSAPVAGNEDRLRRASPFFATLLAEQEFQFGKNELIPKSRPLIGTNSRSKVEITILRKSIEVEESRFLQLQLTSSNAELIFSKVMSFLNTGDFDMIGCTSEQMLAVANECQILSLQERSQESFPTPLPKPVSHYPLAAAGAPLPCPVPIFSPVPNPFLLMDLQSQIHAANLLQMMMTQLHSVNPPQEIPDEKSFKRRRAHGDLKEMKKAHSLDSSDEPYDNLGDVIIPSTDKEGWCRNKKYIEKTDGGFMCMVCKKVYGRYNSVSYHVTIYHRNPPIKCDLPGCQFTTREARYIHFHKYYRHGIALPDSIDQGSRRCPHCRHVSKSPAMLEKHIRRHQIVETRDDSAEVDSTSMDVVVVDDEMTEEERTRGVSLSMEVYEAPEEDAATKPRAFTL